MDPIRRVVSYKHYFQEFLTQQTQKVQDKIYKIIELIEHQRIIPSKYLKHIEGSSGLYETRFSFGTNIWRVFCFFDEGNLVILLNGFQKKTEKTPKNEIEKALKLQTEYYKEKDEKRKNK